MHMLLTPHTDLANLIFGFASALFLGMVCLLRIEHRRDVLRQARLNKSLRRYAASSKGRTAAPELEADSQPV